MDSWARKNWLSEAALLFLAVLGQTYVNWQSEQTGYWGRALKGQELQQSKSDEEGNTVPQHWTVSDKMDAFLSTNACIFILAVT